MSVNAAWPPAAGHYYWLRQQARELAAFGRAAVRPEGAFWWLDDGGRPDPAEPLHTWIACRATHVNGLAHLLGDPDAGAVADHGVAALTGPLRDPVHGGWFGSVDPHGAPVDERKAAYP